MSTTERGRTAETLAAAYLEQRGYTILDRNWRNRWCELDIVARSPAGIHFVEVKYRHRADWGTGFEHITTDKANRLRRAALAWIQAHRYYGPYQIDVISALGDPASPAIELLSNAITD